MMRTRWGPDEAAARRRAALRSGERGGVMRRA